jgi:hypothetical protein
MSVALGLIALRAPDIVETVKFRGLSINGDFPQAYLDGNFVSIFLNAARKLPSENPYTKCISALVNLGIFVVATVLVTGSTIPV